MLDSTEPTYGEVDGEAVDDGRVAISGGGHLLRRLSEGETVVLLVRGVAGLPSYERLKDETLRRVDHVKLELVVEPGGELRQLAVDAIAEQASLEVVVDPNQGRLDVAPAGDEHDDDGLRAD